MCDKNIIDIINLDFSLNNDSFNWGALDSSPINTVESKLLFFPKSNSTAFRRFLGNVDPTNDTISVKSNIQVKYINSDKIDVTFRVVSGNLILDESNISFEDLTQDIDICHYFERDIKYDADVVSEISLIIIVTSGIENSLFLKDLKVSSFLFCQQDVRTYFVIDNLFNDSLKALSSGIKLKEWKINGTETLTTEFFNDTNIVGGNPLSEWKFSKANLDATERVLENIIPNTFNPFVDEFKLDFDTVDSFYGGKPLGVTNGNEYGVGILQIGVDKPIILNRSLKEKKGAFFIDINYDESIKVVFDVIVNTLNSELYVSPDYIRTYTLEWNTNTCEKSFSYTENNIVTDELHNGFLSGVSGNLKHSEAVPYGNYIYGTGEDTVKINFGNETGILGIEYNPGGVPDRFILKWDENIVGDTGYVGNSAYNHLLVNVPSEDINTNSGPVWKGQIFFNKTTAEPNEVEIKVLTASLSSSWEVEGILSN